MEDFSLNAPVANRSAEKGKAAFTKAQCIVCHRFGNEGGLIGPDLSAVASRFDRRALLESIIEPSKVIDEKFRNTLFTMKDGSSVSGTVEGEDDKTVVVRENPFAEKSTVLSKQLVQRREGSAISPMPSGLINGLTAEEVMDLLGLLSSGARQN